MIGNETDLGEGLNLFEAKLREGPTQPMGKI
jgi:hypothetical protein